MSQVFTACQGEDYRPVFCWDLTRVGMLVFFRLLFTGDHIKWDLRYLQKTTYFTIFTINILPYLLWPPVIGEHSMMGSRNGRRSNRISNLDFLSQP